MSAWLPYGRRTPSLLIPAMLLLCLPVVAQDQATLVGTVADPSGAPIPGAKVRVQAPDIGFVRDSVTNSAGEYNAAKIPIGNYLITAEASGFRKLVRSGITLDVGQTLRVDLQMTVGQVNQEVTVSGSAIRVETENATISDVVSGNQIQDLTLVGRNYQTLTILTPGAAPGCVLPVNPTTGQPFPGDMVPIDPNAQAILNSVVPLPNNGIDGYVKAPSTPTNWGQEQIRVDQNISDKTTAFVRFTQDTWNQNLLPALWTGAVTTRSPALGRFPPRMQWCISPTRSNLT